MMVWHTAPVSISHAVPENRKTRATRRIAAVAVAAALPLTIAMPAAAQEAEPLTWTDNENIEDLLYDGEVLDWGELRDPSDCKYQQNPPDPILVDRSEDPEEIVDETTGSAPQTTIPDPLPAPSTTPGGPQMEECGTVAAPDFQIPEELSSTSWMVADLNSGEVLAAQDPHGRYRPASIIKVLVAITAIRELNLEDTIEVTFEDASVIGSRAGLVDGVQYSVKTLLQGLILNSGNDCASALSRALGGEQETVRKVNELAKELGATDTRVFDVSGLEVPGQMTSAFDLALFYRAAFENETYRELSATTLATMPGDGDLIEDFEMANDNQLLQSGYDGALGGKTGFTDEARHTFVGVSERGDRRIAAIILDNPASVTRPWEEAVHLSDAGYMTPAGQSVGSLNELPHLSPEAAERVGDDPADHPALTDAVEDNGNTLWIAGGLLAAVILLAGGTFALGSRKRRRNRG